jgi:hypothetical protein
MNKVVLERLSLFVSQRTLLHDFHGHLLKLAYRRLARFECILASPLRIKNELVDFALARSELARGRVSPGDVGRVIAVLRTDVDYYQITSLDLLSVLPIVEDGRIDA